MSDNNFGTYRLKSNEWRMRCANGKSLGAGLSAMGLSTGIKVMRQGLIAEKLPGYGKATTLDLEMTLTGFELSAELGLDLIEAVSGLSVAYIKPDSSNTVPPLINAKNANEMKSYDFTGPCALISYSSGEVSIGKELKKLRGRTFLLIGMHSTVADNSADWLTKVVDATEGKSTLGGAFKAFNKEGSVFNHARAALPVSTTEYSYSAKVKGVGIAIYSGKIIAKGCS